MFRSIVFLGIIGAVLVGAGILHVNWNNSTESATISLDKDKAKQAAVKLLDEAKVLEANLQNNQAPATK
ncbi:MAG TPA: hypothetical protein VHD36_02565 [Pirellulales bacterium]|nr:hypothetical protein [Pirellulales bacterium]